MLKIELLGIPSVKFAHIFSAPTYEMTIPVREGYFEISYISEGEVEETVEGEIIKKTIHDVTCSLGDRSRSTRAKYFHEHHTVCFYVPYRENDEGEGVIHIPRVLNFSGRNEIHKLIDEIIRVSSTCPDRAYTLGGLVLQLLDAINAEAIKSANTKRDNISLYEHRAIKYIYENVHKPITQKDIARYLGITPEYFSAVFKAARGMPPMQFINRVKLSSIRMLMARENLKLYEAAERYGYTDANYVSKLFKKYYGINITSSLTKKFTAIEEGGEEWTTLDNSISLPNDNKKYKSKH